MWKTSFLRSSVLQNNVKIIFLCNLLIRHPIQNSFSEFTGPYMFTLIMVNFGNAFSVIKMIEHRWRCYTNTFEIERLSILKQSFAGFVIVIMN